MSPNRDTGRRITLHWTAGAHRASDHDRCAYHYLVEHHEGDPEDASDDVTQIVQGVPVERNLRDCSGLPSYCRDEEEGYAAHTRGFNSWSVGVSVCAMRGAVDRRPAGVVDPGPSPVTRLQVEALCGLVASLTAQHDLEVSVDTVFTHWEAEAIHDRPQRGKWDITWLPGIPVAPADVGFWLRSQVRRVLDGESVDWSTDQAGVEGGPR